MRPEDYKDQDGCHNCGHVFVNRLWDGGPEYYCHVDNSERPLCMSIAMGETVEDYDEYCKALDSWEAWAYHRQVNGWGKCSKWCKE